jgi:hypothetical protein
VDHLARPWVDQLARSWWITYQAPRHECTGQTAAPWAKSFCRVHDSDFAKGRALSPEGDCLACQLYIDEHMNK